MGLFKSDEEKEYILEKIKCEVCGKTYYRAKSKIPPRSLENKYVHRVVMQCNICGKIYCLNDGNYDQPPCVDRVSCTCKNDQAFELEHIVAVKKK